jgi:hypothetical protein
MFAFLKLLLLRPRLAAVALISLGALFSCIESCFDDDEDDDDEDGEVDGDPCEGAVGCEKIPD